MHMIYGKKMINDTLSLGMANPFFQNYKICQKMCYIIVLSCEHFEHLSSDDSGQ